MSENVEVKLAKGLTIKAVLFGLICLGLIHFVEQYAYAARGFDIWILLYYKPTHNWGASFWQYSWIAFKWMLPFFIMLAINKVKPGLFSRQEAAVVYTIILMSAGWNVVRTHPRSWYSDIAYLAALYIVPEPQFSYMLEHCPWGLLAPDPKVNSQIFKDFLSGGVPVPWREWTFPIIMWVFLTGSYIFFNIFLGALLRKLFLESENLQFPLGLAAKESIDIIMPEQETKRSLSKYFWIGFLVSFVIMSYYFIPSKVPELAYLPRIDYSLTHLALIPWVPLHWSFYPFLVGWGLLLPIDVLTTGLIFCVILWYILPPIYNMLGWTRPCPTGGTFLTHFVEWGGPGCQGPGGSWEWPQGYMNMNFALITLICVIPFILNKDVVKMTLKAMVSTTKSAIDEGEPMRYFYLLIGTIFFGILWICMLSIIGVPVLAALVIGTIIVMYAIGSARMRGEYGAIFGGMPWSRYLDVFIVALLIAMGVWGVDYKASYATLIIMGSIFFPWWWSGSAVPICESLESYKVGEQTKTSNKDIFIAQIISVIFLLIIAIPIYLWLCYTFGAATNMSTSMSRMANEGNAQMRTYVEHTLGSPTHFLNEKSWGTMLAGFAIGIIIYALRIKNPGLILNPYGVLLASTQGYIIAITELVIALVIKAITLKVGGIKLYEEKIAPLASGMIFGLGLSLLLFILLGLV